MMKGRVLAAAAALLTGVALLTASTGPATANHTPADKVVASGSSVEFVSPSNGPVELLAANLKTSSPTDLILQVSAECALWTDVATTGNDQSSAVARVEMWIEIDGQVVKVDAGDTNTGGTGGPLEVGQAGMGRVVFCNRAFALTTTAVDDQDMMIKIFNRTRQANGFNWLKLNVGSGHHTIKVYGSLTTEATHNAFAKAAVGKRTLIVEPAKLANDATI